MALKEKTTIGLDIGAFSVKFAQISWSKDKGRRLVKFGVRRVAGSTKKKLAEELSALAREMPEKTVNVSVSGPSVVVRYVFLPKMNQEELAASMQFEAEKYIPFNVADVILDHQILEHDAGGRMKVLLVAAKKDAVKGRLELLQEAHLNAGIIDIDSFALINTFLANYPGIDAEKPKALLNIGEALSSVNIVSRGLPCFTRDFLIGGADITKSISQSLSIDIVSAQNLKHNPEKEADIIEVARPVLSNMAEEVRMSLSYYENQCGSAVDEIYLSGGTCRQSGLTQFLGDALGAACKLWDPVKNLTAADDISKEKLDEVRLELPVAIGLALRE